MRENARYRKTPHDEQSESPAQQETPIRPPPDIQAILSVIARRNKYLGNGEDRGLNLSGNYQYVEFAVDLRGANLNKAHLEGADLRGARLEGASLIGANLRGAALWEAHLDDSFLIEANLEQASLEGASLRNARLVGSNFANANLSGVDLTNAVVSREQLAKAMTLSGATLPNGEILSFEESERITNAAREIPSDGKADA